jgi:transposase
VAKRIKMKKAREVIRMHEELHLSGKKISKALGVSRPVISEYISGMKKAGLSYKDIAEMKDDRLLELIRGKKKRENIKYQTLEADFDIIMKELKRPGVTLSLLHEEYTSKNLHPYSYSQYCYHFQKWSDQSEISMHMEHKAGDKMFVDFTGKKMQITNSITGELTDVEIFISVLGASSLFYVEAVASQKKEDFIRATENAFYYYGGVPCAVMPDCLKSAVTKADKYEPDINHEYGDFARHYRTTIFPARSKKPKDKALAENAVKNFYTNIFARLRDRIFFSIEELNIAILELLEKFNNRPMQRTKVSRRDLFNEIEKAHLMPLPNEKYEIKHYKSLKAQFNYHVYLIDDKHYYSIPYRLRGRQIELFYTDSTVEIYENNVRIAFHKRNRKPNGYTTIKEHMPPNHKWVADWHPDRFKKWAMNIGEDVHILIEKVLNQRQYPEQSYKTCLGILSLAKKYPKERFIKACAKAVHYECYTYKKLDSILKNNMENMGDESDLFETLPDHENIRGNEYYYQEISL